MQFNKEYVSDPALSQSDIKLFESDLIGFYQQKILGLEREDKKTTSIGIGSVIDAALLKPEELKNYYVITDLKAKGKVKDVIDRFISKITSKPDVEFLEFPEFTVTDIADKGYGNEFTASILELEYQGNWKMETRVNDIISKGKAYYEQMQQANGRVIISMMDWNLAHEKVDNMQKDEYTAKLHQSLFNPTDPNVQVCRAEVLYGEFEGVKLKGELDLFLKNDVEKWIDPWDAKSSLSHGQFKVNYQRFKYGRQGTFYTELLKQNYPGYTIHPFKFLVIPTKTQEKPEQYEMSASEMYIHAEGITTDKNYTIKGWKTLIREIMWHQKTGKWDHRKEYYINGKNVLDSRVNIDELLQELDNNTTEAPLI